MASKKTGLEKYLTKLDDLYESGEHWDIDFVYNHESDSIEPVSIGEKVAKKLKSFIHPNQRFSKKKLTKKEIVEPTIKTNISKWKKLLNKDKYNQGETVVIKDLKTIVDEGLKDGTIDKSHSNYEMIEKSNQINKNVEKIIQDKEAKKLADKLDAIYETGEHQTGVIEADNPDPYTDYNPGLGQSLHGGEQYTNRGHSLHGGDQYKNDWQPDDDFYDPEPKKESEKKSNYYGYVPGSHHPPGPEFSYNAMYQRNVLHDYDSPTYNFRLSMLSEKDTISAQKHILAGQDAFDKWKANSFKPVIIAETGSTVLNIQSVNIEAVAGPMNNGHRVTGGVSFQITVAQPLGVSFTNTLVNAAVRMGIPDGLKATYLLELKWIGRVPQHPLPHMKHLIPGDIVKEIPDCSRQFLINIVGVDTTVDTTGGIYNIMAVRSGDQGTYEHVYTTDRPMQINNIKTVKDLCDKLAEAININELDKLAIEKAILDEYYITLGPEANKVLAKDYIVPTGELEKESTGNNANVYTDTTKYDPILRSFVIPQDTGLNRILEFGLSHSKKLQNLAKGFDENSDDPDSNDSANIKKYKKYIFRIKVDVVNIAWDNLRNDYAREYHYKITLFPTVRPEILQGTWIDHKKAVKAKIKELISDDFTEGKGTKYRSLRKRYDYLFTGLSDKVIRFDIKYNNNFFMAMSSYQNLFSGFSNDAKKKIKKSSSTLKKYKKQVASTRKAWKKYLTTKTLTLDESNRSIHTDDALTSSMATYQKEKDTLISQYVENIGNGSLQGDEGLANVLSSVKTSKEKMDLMYGEKGGNPHEVKDKSNLYPGQVYELGDATVPPILKKLYAEKIQEDTLTDMVNAMDNPVRVSWGAGRDALAGKFNNEMHPENPGKGHFDSVMQGTLSDFQADMVQMDMDIRGDMYWLESESDPRALTSSYYAGENYLLFTARLSAGEPDHKINGDQTGISRPGDSHKETLLNGVYAVINVNSRFEGGQFIQNIKGPRENFIFDISVLESFWEDNGYSKQAEQTQKKNNQVAPVVNVDKGSAAPGGINNTVSAAPGGYPDKKVFNYSAVNVTTEDLTH